MTKQEKLEAIARMEQELATLKKDVEKESKSQWQYEKGKTFMLYLSSIVNNCAGDAKPNLELGIYRITKENAQKSLLRNKRANRLEALVEHIQGNLKGDYCIYQEYKNIWEFGLKNIKQPGVVTMQQETAIKICEMLNNSEFSLEGEL